MSTEYSKISLNQIDIESLADYVVDSKNLVYRNNEIDSSSNKAMDVDKVANVDANRIAVAIDKDHRTTIDNALKLGGKPASEYMTLTTGMGIASNQVKMKAVYGDSIRNLQDELYQLRNELVKGGMIENRGQYNGFIDTFKNNHYINMQNKLGIANTINTSDDDEIHLEDLSLYESLDVGDFICIENEATNSFDIKEIVSKIDENRNILLDSDLSAMTRGTEYNIYKSKGIIHNGLYKFANPANNQLSEEEYHTGLSDDTYNVIKRLNEPNKGFGYSFRVPEAKQGYVTSFEICAKAVGKPGALMCYLIDARDLDKFNNPQQAEADYLQNKEQNQSDGFKFFAKSQPYQLDSALGKRYIKFNFLQSDGTYPLMTRDIDSKDGEPIRYIAVVELLEGDQSNYVDMVFLQHKNAAGERGDLELNNITYYYTRKPDVSAVNALASDEELNKSDMYYHIVTRGVVENEPEAQKQGLYSAHYSFMDQKSGVAGDKARLMLRIKREGKYKVKTESEEPKVYDRHVFEVVNEDKDNEVKTVEDLRLKTDTYKRVALRSNDADISEPTNIVIGNNITKAQGINDTTVSAQTPVLLRTDDKIYRCNYLVNLKARKITMSDGAIWIGKYQNYILPLVDVYKDFEPTSRDWSDRLIFEADLTDKKLTAFGYNDFELQIFWENRELSGYSDIKRAQMGAIKDLVLTFTKGFSSDGEADDEGQK